MRDRKETTEETTVGSAQVTEPMLSPLVKRTSRRSTPTRRPGHEHEGNTTYEREKKQWLTISSWAYHCPGSG